MTARTKPLQCDACEDATSQLTKDFDAKGCLRGWLCHRCIAILALVGDSPAKLSKLADLLEAAKKKGPKK
jgi:hypothetical protein